MERLLELGGGLLASAYAFYGVGFLLIPAFCFAHLGLLFAVTWGLWRRARGRRAWPYLPERVRRSGRLAIELCFGLLNPVLYLAVLTPALPDFSFPSLRPEGQAWFAALTASAWLLLFAFWLARVVGSALDPGRPAIRAGIRVLLGAALTCVLLHAVKDAWMLLTTDTRATPLGSLAIALNFMRLCPLYLIPAVLLADHLRSANAAPSAPHAPRSSLFLLPPGAGRAAVAGLALFALVTLAVAGHRRSDAAVRRLVAEHRDAIRGAAARYDVDPRLLASIVYVTHRDELSPFRGSLERLFVSAWASNLRRELGIGPPDHVEQAGSDDNPLLNRALDISVGLAQIKPRTAQTASVLATGRTPDQLPAPEGFAYRDVEPVGDAWTPETLTTRAAPPLPVPAERYEVASVLLEAESNLATCALILSLYQRQWEAADRAFSLRERPEILATLYQIGFARSKPHAAPRSNAFGGRVRQVYEERWLAELLEPAPRPRG
jgi:hypothetical protein